MTSSRDQVAAARDQIAAANEQTKFLKREAERDLARQSLTSTSLLLGVCSEISFGLKRVESELQKPPLSVSRGAVPRDLLQTVSAPALGTVWRDLGHFGEEFASNYLLLNSKIEKFRSMSMLLGTEVENEIAEIRNFLEHLERTLSAAAKECHEVLKKSDEAKRTQV